MQRRAALGLMWLMFLIGAAGHLTAAENFPLRVRGGRDLRMHAVETRSRSMVRLVIEFDPADHRAGDGLRPGQGAWLDRGVGRGEPERLEWTLNDRAAQHIIDNLRDPENFYTFDCFRVGGDRGYFEITRIARADIRR